jgi:hypothetical protein
MREWLERKPRVQPRANPGGGQRDRGWREQRLPDQERDAPEEHVERQSPGRRVGLVVTDAASDEVG